MVFDIGTDAGVTGGAGSSSGKSTSRSPRLGLRPPQCSASSSEKSTAFGTNNTAARGTADGTDVKGKGGTAATCLSPEFVGFPILGGGWREGTGDTSLARRNSLPSTPSGKRNANVAAPGPLSRWVHAFQQTSNEP